MKPGISKRIDALEKSLCAKQQEWVVIWQWGHDSEQLRQENLARWRAGEDIEGAPTHTRDRANANVAMIEFVSPKQ